MPPAPTNNVDRLVEQFLTVRNALDRIKERYEQEREGLVNIREVLTGRLLKIMETTGTTSLRSPHGTATLSVKHTASVTDPDMFMKYVIASNNFDLLERRANATAVIEYVKKNNNLPPGTNLSEWRGVGVRTPSQKPE